MTRPRILVTGATGKTGTPVVEQLLDSGFPVRALIRKRDERSARLAQLGAELVIGDFHDLASIRGAMRDVERVYFCYPPQDEHLVDATAIAAIAAKDAGVSAFVNMSQITAREDAPSRLSRQHWQSERILDWAGVGAVHVRPSFFAENLFMFGAQTIATEGKLYLPYGPERHAPVSAADIARVVTTILRDPADHAGATYVLTGPRNLTIAEMADELSQGLGTGVDYVDLPIDAWGEVLTGVPGMSASLISHLQAVAQDHKDGIFNAVTNDVERVTGAPAETLAEFIESAKAGFGFGPGARSA